MILIKKIINSRFSKVLFNGRHLIFGGAVILSENINEYYSFDIKNIV